MLASFPELHFERSKKAMPNSSLLRHRTPLIVANNPFEQSLLDFLRDFDGTSADNSTNTKGNISSPSTLGNESQNEKPASPKSL
jgi:hypothetical protein